MIKNHMRKHIIILVALTTFFVGALLSFDSWAQPVDPPNTPAGTCTFDPTYNIPTDLRIITTIVDGVICNLYGPQSGVAGCNRSIGASQNIFEAIAFQTGFQGIIRAVATLFITIFGIAFMLGIVRLTIIEFTIRAFKLSVVVIALSPGAWELVYSVIGVLFQNGTDWLIARSTQIALGTIPGVNPSQPFNVLDTAVATAFSAKMFVTIIAMFFTGPYGWLFGILTVIGLGSFVAALFQGIWVYLMSSVVRAFLFGLAPIFFIFLLFSRTRHLFDGWLNQLVNSLLQPVLLFTFFSFFAVLVLASMERILRVEVCYMPGSGLFTGLPGDVVIPRPTVNGQLYGREWSFGGPVDFPNHAPFFIDIIDVLIFILLTQLAWRFNGIAINVAKELASVSTTYNIPGAFNNLLSPRRSARRNAIAGEFAQFNTGGNANFSAFNVANNGGGADEAPVDNRNAQGVAKQAAGLANASRGGVKENPQGGGG